ncbi:Periplasmic aromatic aldehyde oxidoreductase, FAD binding subunit YagS [Pseudonocardia sp. Ae168_Ps1]|uniref:FAD binding domain-containing protein n=1 Tax=unclassified Pseudonocardia TaxID=2619320 RepID=UPI00094B2E5F|nr:MULTISPECIES: xanthine dehydrogenase family protein subunit M [unclassified Pseudonocardia]OLL72411.1 Periplasmic aromatic aldehyde oxidoreductase, FAD binding subunit YagS [Pseudonocardia sp. Ae150A_Ps1]OLL78383.1 Periplasmic aromatic aldehyde oxidoreductase, FAD binding subunit YagS [Pseudonocardia sp. Ae168_Ps1]OLL87491.1 Periplasmic aromatic aldehyde oxidoreductase, FAD binding subunit YagS [Pseudonocardia sp. Ae263_Ps1]OLL92480.1 Periplasmic aromatic aldehyde oxidoreductase, FAD binding
MRPFELTAPGTVDDALDSPGAFLAGGTTLVDLMKLDVLTPERVVDINALPLRGIDTTDGLRIGALERMSDVAAHPGTPPVIARALLLSASQQLRNMASIGGNLMQRTRCGYFRDVAVPCNRRDPGSGCPAIGGANRMHAVLGTSDACVATHASDLAVALVALDARLRLAGPDGDRTVALTDFYRTPGDTPEVENDLRTGELIGEVLVPRHDHLTRSTYVKVRDRQSYEFALCSAAVALDVRDGRVDDVRVAVGGVATVPWRLPAVEDALRGAPATQASFEEAAAVASDGARPLSGNAFKLPLVRRTVVRALPEAMQEDPA